MTLRRLRRMAAPWLLLAFLLGTPRSAAGQAPPDTLAFTLEEAILQSLAESPEVAVASAERAFAAARQRFARANRFLTEFQATSAHSVAPALDAPDSLLIPAEVQDRDEALYLDPRVRNNAEFEALRPFNQVEVEALQPIFTWGELSGNIRAARYGVDVEAAGVDEQRLVVALRTGEIYFNVLLAEELFRIAEETGDVITQAKREINRLLEEGAEDVDYADLYQVQLTEQEYNRRVVEVTQRRSTARTALARQLFLPEGALVLPGDAFLEPISFALDSLDVYFQQALQRRPELAQARAGLAARSALVDVATSDYFPKLFLGASVRFRFVEGRPNQRNPFVGDAFSSGSSVQAGLGLRQNLNFLQTRASVQQARAERNQVQYQLEGARQLVLFEVEEAYRTVIITQAALDAADEALTISRNWLRDEQINFDLDLGDTENLVDAVRANLEQRARYYEAVQAYNLAVLRLLRATGTLVDRTQAGTLVEDE